MITPYAQLYQMLTYPGMSIFIFYFSMVTVKLPFQKIWVYTLQVIFNSAYFPIHLPTLSSTNPFIIASLIGEKQYRILRTIESL